MDLASHQRLVSLTGATIARAWISAFGHVRSTVPPHAVMPDPPALHDALRAYASAQHNAYLAAGHAAMRWLSAQLTEPVRLRKKLLSFDPADDNVMSWAERNRLNLVSGVGMEQRSLIRAQLIRMTEEGTNPKTAARDLWESLGLTPAQEQIVQNYRSQLEEGQFNAALERELSHGASDRAIAAAARAGRKLTSEQIDTAVSRYRENLQRLRAETIMRTEGARVANQAMDEAYRQAIARGDVDADQLEQTWYHSPGAKAKYEREFHKVMHGQVRPWGEPFVSGKGNELRFPCDPDAPGDETVNCRCARVVRVRAAAAQAA